MSTDALLAAAFAPFFVLCAALVIDDVVLAAESGRPGAAQWAEDLVGYLATRLGCRLERASDPTGEVVLHAAEAAAHAGAAVQGAARAAADGVVDEEP